MVVNLVGDIFDETKGGKEPYGFFQLHFLVLSVSLTSPDKHNVLPGANAVDQSGEDYITKLIQRIGSPSQLTPRVCCFNTLGTFHTLGSASALLLS